MRKRFIFGFSMLCLLLAFQLFVVSHHKTQQQIQQAQPQQYRQTQAPVTVEKIAENIYQVKGGSGANTGFFISGKEVLVIDAKMTADSARDMLAEIRKMTTLPLGHLVLTHSDGDHINGLLGFPGEIRIICHENAKEEMTADSKDENLKSYLVNITTYKDRLELEMENEKVQLFHFGPAHTSGDTVVYFPEEKVAFLGDLFQAGRDPLIHRHKNGNSFGLVKTLKATLDLGAEIFLSGHTDQVGRSEVEMMILSIEEKQAQIKAMIGEGKSLEEIKKFYEVKERPARPGRPRFMSLPEVIYLELTEKK